MSRLASTAILILAFAAYPACAGIVINEIMQNPDTVSDSNGEWFEVYNDGDSAVDMDGWTILDDDYDDHVIDNGGPLVIAAGGYLVFGKSAVDTLNGGYDCDYEYGSSITLANSSDELVLLDTDSLEVDRVNYDDDFGWYIGKGSSMSLINYTFDNNVADSWFNAHILAYGLGDFGTPGMANEPYFDLVISDYPDTVAHGEYLEFNVYVGNPTPYAETVDIWAGVVSNSVVMELINYNNITLPSGFETTAPMSFFVPAIAPLETYTFTANIGEYDFDVWAKDDFDFEIVE